MPLQKCLIHVLVLISVLSVCLALRCHECANLIRKESTCSSSRKKIVESNNEGSMCRIFTKGGEIVGQGLVYDSLCTYESLTSSLAAISRGYSGSGVPDAFCCDRDLCFEKPAEPSSETTTVVTAQKEPLKEENQEQQTAPLTNLDPRENAAMQNRMFESIIFLVVFIVRLMI